MKAKALISKKNYTALEMALLKLAKDIHELAKYYKSS
jgi:hypothetical protein